MYTFKHLIVLVVCLNLDFVICDKTKVYFPTSNSNSYPRILIPGSLPELKEFTVCAWIKLYTINGLETIFSYSTPSHVNRLVIGVRIIDKKTYIDFFNAGSMLRIPCNSTTWKAGEWHHICVKFFAPSGTASFYVDYNLCEEYENYAAYVKKSIPAGGLFIIGQRQNGLNSVFNANEAFHGEITDLNIWSEMLSIEQIYQTENCFYYGSNNQNIQGDVFAWLQSEMTVTDNVTFSGTLLCKYLPVYYPLLA